MKFKVEPWSISQLIEKRDKLLLNPRYQRGVAWNQHKQALLIDTILMGYDVPKLYFSKNNNGALHGYDVVDGQQRLLALYRFIGLILDERGQPLKLRKKYGLEWSEHDEITYNGLSSDVRRKFLESEITVSIISNADNNQLRRLFLRLQMGSTLNQAELRNALASVNGDHINALAENHNFFKNTAIPIGRFKRQDYLAQGIVHARGLDENSFTTVDAETTKELYLETKPLPMKFWEKVNKVLGVMSEISKCNPRAFYNKWMFVDFFAYLWVNQIKLEFGQAEDIASALITFENERISVRKEPEKLVGKKGHEPKLLLGYVDAFYKDGGLAKNLEKRFNFIEIRRTILNLE